MRLFIAIELPEDVRRDLGRLQEVLRADAHAGAQKAAWVRPQNLHITLKFLGETSDDQAARLCAALREVPFEGGIHLRWSNLLCLPLRGPVRIIAIALAGDLEPLCQLQGQVEAVCDQMGFGRENRRYLPHVTIARCRPPLPPLRRQPLIDRAAASAPSPFEVRQFVLMQSILSREAAQYTPLARFGPEPKP
jgi:RNA 2',3'-cyclic 3'-phosphodiesterase